MCVGVRVGSQVYIWVCVGTLAQCTPGSLSPTREPIESQIARQGSEYFWTSV